MLLECWEAMVVVIGENRRVCCWSNVGRLARLNLNRGNMRRGLLRRICSATCVVLEGGRFLSYWESESPEDQVLGTS
jgi:hypothetical protein